MARILAERHGDRIWVKSPWYPRAAAEAKSVPGASWRKTDRAWSYPLSYQTCKDLRRTYGDRLTIGPELWSWAKAEKQRRARLRKLGRQADAQLEIVPEISPKLDEAMKSRTYQRSGARFGAEAGRALFADQPSLGKTAMCLAAIMEAGHWNGRHLVIAPKTSLRPTWARQIGHWSDATAIPVPEGRAEREEVLRQFSGRSSPSLFLCINPAMLRVKMGKWCKECEEWDEKGREWPAEHHWFGHKLRTEVREMAWPELFDITWDAIILDECHEALSAVTPGNVSQTVEGLNRLKQHPGSLKIAATGTPIRGREQKLWGVRSWLDLGNGGYWTWVDSFFKVDDNGFGRSINGIREDRAEDFAEELDSYVLRRTKREVQPDTPEKDIQAVWVRMSPKHRQQYEKFESEGEVAISGGSVDSYGVLSELGRLKQFAFGLWSIDDDGKMRATPDSPKLDWLIQALADRGVTGSSKTEFKPEEGVGHKYIIASQFTTIVDAVEERLRKEKIPALKITGAVTGRKRTDAVESFNSPDGPRVLVLNTATGGVSLDLDRYCDEMFILDETWVADDQEQLEGRIDNRSGRIANRTFHYVRTEDTIEERIAQLNITQDEMQKNLLDRRRGVETAMRLLKK